MTTDTPRVPINWFWVAGVAAALTLLFATQNYIAPGVRGQETFAVNMALQSIVWGTWLLLSPLIFAAARKWRKDPRFTARKVLSQAGMCLAVAMLQAGIAGWIRWYVDLSVTKDPVDVVISSMLSFFGANTLRYWLIASAYHAIAYHHEVRHRDLRAARLESSLLQAQLDNLQGRLQPHFLFNTLNSISALIRDQPAAAEQMIGNLSELLRASLNADPEREVTLDREIDLARQYVSIQQIRFADRLAVDFDVSPESLGAYVPHLVLQPLVENAIRHGIAPREGRGRVRIAAGRSGERLRLLVEDDGIGLGERPEAPTGTGFGLSGTRARLQQLYGGDAHLDIASRTPTGVVATVDLPFRVTPALSPQP